MNKECFIVEDLLPLYNDDLLQEETAKWLESHLDTCEHCRALAILSNEPINKERIPSSIEEEKMFAKIHLKLSIFQIIFVAFSFFFAIQTSLLNDSLGFILTYAILGFVTYLFYQRMIVVITIAFLPIFIWSLFQIATFNLDAIFGSIFVAIIHLLFALVGSVIGLLIIKLKERG